MPVYEYKATDIDSSPASGTIIADTPRQARDQLREKGLTVCQIEELKEESQSGGVAKKRKKSQNEVVAFIRELATLLSAGISLLPALRTLSDQHHKAFKGVIQKLADMIASGSSLAEAMERQPMYFDQFITSIVRVGESTGSLDGTLKKLADFKEKSHRLTSQVITAMIYPCVICVIGLAVSIFLMTYVVPSLLATLEQSGKPLPAVTMMVKGISDIILNWWWLMLLAAAGAVFAYRSFVAKPKGRLFVDKLLLRIPLLGSLINKETTSRMAVVLSALLRNGLQFVQAVQITRATLGNVVFQNAMEEYEKAVASGKDVAGPLAKSGVFTPMVIQMLAVGQQTGELENMLDQLAESYDRQVSIAAQRLTAALEPLMIVLLAIVVGFIAFATILPILEAADVM